MSLAAAGGFPRLRPAPRGPIPCLAAFALLMAITGAPAGARTAAAPKAKPITAGQFVAIALENQNTAYVATRTSIFWSEHGRTRVVVAQIYKDGNRTRYDYAASGDHPRHSVIETAREVYMIGPGGRDVVKARRQRDPDIEGIRMDLALKNYDWRFEPARVKSPRRREVTAYRKGTRIPKERFWILTDRMVVTRSERYGRHNELRSSWTLSQIQFVNELPDRVFRPRREPSTVVREIPFPVRVSPQNVDTRAGFHAIPLPASEIPHGYRLVDTFVEQGSDGKAVRFFYSDGLDSFSLVEAPRPPSRVALSTAHVIHILDRTAQVVSAPEADLVHWQAGGLLYTLIGSQQESALLHMSRVMIAAAPRPSPTRPTPVAAPPAPRSRTFAEIMSRGWARFLRIIGLR